MENFVNLCDLHLLSIFVIYVVKFVPMEIEQICSGKTSLPHHPSGETFEFCWSCPKRHHKSLDSTEIFLKNFCQLKV